MYHIAITIIFLLKYDSARQNSVLSKLPSTKAMVPVGSKQIQFATEPTARPGPQWPPLGYILWVSLPLLSCSVLSVQFGCRGTRSLCLGFMASSGSSWR